MKNNAYNIKLEIVSKADTKQLHALRTDQEVAALIKRDLNQSTADIERFIEKVTADPNKLLFYKIELIPSGELAGAIVLKNISQERKYAEVGYELFPRFQGKGIMSFALNEMIQLAFETLQLEELEAYTHRENRNSRKLLERFNFSEVIGKTDKNNPNNVIYALKKGS